MIGHEWAVDLLSAHVAQGQERHAYLITGPQGVGRRTLALRFAEALNCVKSTVPGKPCRKCSTCKRIEGMQHPDLAVVEAEHEGEVLRIDQVRDLQHSLSLAPYEARYRVALILRFEEAHPSAANAMLKTLEEPPPQVVVILTALSAESLLPTIVSRCEVLRLRPQSIDETAKGMQAVKGVPKEQAENLAHLSGVLLVGFVQASQYFVYGSVEFFLVGYLTEIVKLNDFITGIMITSIIAIGIFARPYVGRLSDRAGRRIPILIGCIISGLPLLALPFVLNFWVLLLLIVIYGLGFATVLSSTHALTCDLVPKDLVGTSMGFIDTVMDIGQTLGPIASGVILAVSLAYKFQYILVFLTLGLILLATGAIFALSQLNISQKTQN